MKHRFWFVFLAVCLLLTVGALAADRDSETGITYTIENGEATIVKCDFTGKTLEIPASLGGCPVREIGSRAFFDMKALEEECVEKWESRANIMAYRMDNGTVVHVIAEGRLVNIAAADGHPAEIMDLSFAVQAMSAKYIRDHHEELDDRVIDVSDEIDDVIARRKLAAWGIEIDELTPEQEKYLHSWDL